MILPMKKPKQQGLRGLRGLKGLSHYCVMSDSDSDLVSVKSCEINSISETEKGGADDLFAEVFEEKESLAKLTSIVEKARVSVGNESSTLPLLLNVLFCQLETMSKLLIALLGNISSSYTSYVL